MNAVEQRLAALEDEVKRLRRRVRASEQQDQLTLSAALLAQSLAGEERQVLKGYDGPIYDTDPDALTGFSTATDPYTIVTSQVNDSTDEVYLVLKAVKPSGAITYESAISIGYDGTVTGGVGGSDAPFVKISPGADHVFYQELVDFHLASVLHVPDMSSDPTSASGVSPSAGWLLYRTDTDRLRLRANGAWVDIATTDDVVSGAMKVINGGYYLIPAGPGLGTTVTSSASADTYGSWTEMRSASGNALYIVGAIVRTNSNADYTQLDIGTGSAGAETSVSETKLMTPTGTSVAETVYFTYPIAVAANTRIACRTADEDASARASDVTLIVVDQADVASL